MPWTQIDSIKVTYLKITEGSISNMLEEGSYNRGISLSKLVNGFLLLLAWKPFLFGFRSTTYKTSYAVSWKNMKLT